MLLGFFSQVAYCVAENAEVSYTVWHGRRGSGDEASFEVMDASYVIKDDFSMQFSTPDLQRKGLTKYAVRSGFDGDATKAIFTYTPTADFPYLYLYFAIEEYVGFSGHVYPYMSIQMYDGDTPVGCHFRHEGTEAGVKDKFVLSGQSSLYEFYRPWDILIYDLSQYIGHALSIEVIATCCSNVKCWTNFYLAFEKDYPRDLCSSCSIATLAAPTLAKAIWKRNNPFGEIYAKGDSIEIPKSDIDNFYCLMTSYCGVTPILMGRALDIHPEISYSTSCKNGKDTVFLTNTSYMQYRVPPYTKIPCDTTHWLFSDGQSSTQHNLPYVIFSEDGQYKVTFHTGSHNFMCDSTISLNLPFGRQHYTDSVDTICQEHLPYLWRGEELYASGDYTDTLMASTECDSILHLLLTVLDTTVSTTKYSICEGEYVLWNGKKYSEAGTYRDTLVNGVGCDSLLTLIISYKDCSLPEDTTPIPLNPQPFLPIRDSIDTVICIGNFVDWHEMHLTTDTIVRDTGYYSWIPLDSVYWILRVTTKDCHCVDSSFTDVTIPYTTLITAGYQWFGKTYNDYGIFRDTLLSAETILDPHASGCDSIGTLILRTIYRDSITACMDDSVGISTPWGDVPMVCDTIQDCRAQTMGYECLATLFLRVIREDCCPPVPPETITYANISKDEAPYLWRTNTYSLDGEYRDTVQTAAGCDSILILRLHILGPCELPTITLPYKAK